ncbi:putative tRNA adenosine deaminase-associated protein [Kineococcus xinjiangensis]|uniref:Putative tRNA adenosine deaminase-associated protein n=1 Tax=Kineococcus xinjiangensis TaxID=512762 RepID=A0A2S6IFB5_9ACTN|nr:tRNA adenosine deaminase-associated protein [Kineococcus xinjiangensis]PPK92912.1 putative tRNA adenosine deaminase-associated protein [Kineococcus xinjiangensis]
MPYFTAVLASDSSGWRARDVDVPAGSLEELADVLRAAAAGDSPVLAAIESEDEWFALVRADEGGDVRFFVSDAPAASSGSYGPLFSEELLETDFPRPAAAATADGDEDAEDADGDDPEDGVRPVAELGGEPAWAGDPALLADLGCPADDLVELAERGDDPAAALVEVGERLGCADVMESLR